jgi:hypothetical protein
MATNSTGASPMEQYRAAVALRNSVISENRARRMRKGPRLPPLVVPPKPEHPMVPVAYDSEGHYVGRLASVDDAQADWVVKYEPAMY